MGGINGFFISILQGIHSFVGNYGWSVVLFTLLIRFVLLPLDIKQRKSMRAMSKVQPKAMELQKIRGERLEELTEEYERLSREAGERLERPADLAKRLYELEKEYERNTRYA